MKIQVDGKDVFELNETKKKVICNDISDEEFQADMERRVKYIVEHKYDQCMERLKKEWEPKLISRTDSIPTDKDELAKLIFSQPEYKSRSMKIKEEKEVLKLRK